MRGSKDDEKSQGSGRRQYDALSFGPEVVLEEDLTEVDVVLERDRQRRLALA